MRFVRRNRNRLLPRQDVSDLTGDALGPVASEERDALLSYTPISTDSPGLSETDPPSALDPTQRLVTALGRFHRYVAKGQTGAAQDYWSDDCMNQLGLAIEIALSHNWMNIVEALTDVARVLQSYENAGCAHICVPFLHESYEILSLMVGDLIVGNTSSGVMGTWRERYEQAVQELAAAGLALVQDEEEEEEHFLLGPTEAQPPPGGMAPEEREPAGPEPSPAPTAPALDAFLPFIEPEEEAPAVVAAAPAAEEAAESLTPVEQDPLGEPPMEEAPEPVAPAPEEDAGISREMLAVLDSLCDDLARLDTAFEAEHAARLAEIRRKVASLAQYAAQKRHEVSEEICRRMSELCRLASGGGSIAHDRFLDTAYAFCEAYVEASRDPQGVVATSWLSDSAALLDGSSVTPVSGPAVPPEGSPESLLGTAQRAVARGDTAGAKMLALQAVAHMARLEAERAEKQVQETEVRLTESTEAIDRARASVKKAEQDVLVAEGRVGEGEAELAEHRDQVTKTIENVGGIERRMAEIDEQIRALQAARHVEEQRAGETAAELSRARDDEAHAHEELKSLQEAEDTARARLEDARQQVKDFQRRRVESEAALSRGREALLRHRVSLADIERTAGQLDTTEPQAPQDTGGLLF